VHRRILAVVLVASTAVVACSLNGIAAPYSLAGPLRIDVSGLPVNLVVPLVNDTGFDIVSFCIVLTTESDQWLPTFYRAMATNTSGAEVEDFDIDEDRDGYVSSSFENDDNISNNSYRGNVVWLRRQGSSDCIASAEEFQLHMRGGDFSNDEYGSRYDVFPPGTTLTISACVTYGTVYGAVFIGAP